MSSSSRPAPRSILLTCTQRIGDVLLTTPLARSLKRAWPQARLDMLVLPGTEGVLTGNPDIQRVLALPQRVKPTEKLRQLQRLWRQYDLALSPLPTDRARLFCWAAGRHSLGVMQPQGEASKRWLLDEVIRFDDLDTHTVTMGLRLAEHLGIPAIAEVVPPAADWPALASRLGEPVREPYAVLHPYPKFNYKMWSSSGWLALARWLQARGLRVLLTGSPEADERAYAAELVRQSGPGMLSLAGQLTLAETAELLRRAQFYAGPDTALTHIAAACGTPTLALFGPSNPVKWGPWPAGWHSLSSPWPRQGSHQQGNVALLQGSDARACVPCLQEGCQRHTNSYSDCLIELTPARAIEAVQALLSDQLP